MGFLDRRLDQLEDPAERHAANLHVSGKRGGHTINLHRFARDGIRLVGRLEAVEDGRVLVGDDLHVNLAAADDRAREICKAIDEHIAGAGIAAPGPDPDDDYAGADGFDVPRTRQLDVSTQGISTIVWATGYRHGFDWIRLDVTDPHGDPIHDRGVTSFPGLYFLGLHWLHKAKSGLLYGVGEDAAHVVSRITEGAGAAV